MLGKKANAIPGQLDKAVAMHTKQAKELRAAGVGDDKIVDVVKHLADLW